MKDIVRLLRYVRPYSAALLASVALMAVVGIAQAFVVLLVRVVFNRVLQPATVDKPVALYTIPVFHHTIYLQDIFPDYFHNIFTQAALGIIGAFLLKGLCDYAGNYLINYTGLSAVTDLRQAAFERVLRQDVSFFESNSTGRVMSSIMNDIDKIQTAVSTMLADFLRQTFTVIALLLVVIQTDWKLALVSLTVLPFVLFPTRGIGRRIRRISRSAQDHTAELSQILQETISGQHVVKSFGAEEIESNRF